MIIKILLSSACAVATISGEDLGERDIRQAHISQERCVVHFPNSPCLHLLQKEENNHYNATCVASIKEENK